jgi:tetratricopeptide (TPR) repeat protein
MNDEGPHPSPESNKVLGEIKKLFAQPNTSGIGLKDIIGFSPQETDSTYITACQQLQGNSPQAAAKLFALLIAVKHNESKYWRGLGLCMHRMKMFPFAEFLYGMALRWDPDDFISRVFFAETLLKLNKRVKARAECEQAIETGKRLVKPDTMAFLKRGEKLYAFILQSGEAQNIMDR